MTTENAETTSTNTTAAVAEQGAHVAPEKASSKKDASTKKGAPKSQKSAKGGKAKAAATPKPKKATSAKNAPKKAAKAQESTGPREGSKAEQVIAMLKRKNGATLADIMAATGWLSHTTRAFVSATLGKKLGLAVESFKSDKGERTYRINQ